MTDNRWQRMSSIVDIDLDQASRVLKEFEADLENAELQLQTLSDFRSQSECDFSKPSSYQSVQAMQRQLSFIESLQRAMGQQKSKVQEKQQHLEVLRHNVLKLYQKKESYLLLSKKEKDEEDKRQSQIEDHFLV